MGLFKGIKKRSYLAGGLAGRKFSQPPGALRGRPAGGGGGIFGASLASSTFVTLDSKRCEKFRASLPYMSYVTLDRKRCRIFIISCIR